MKRASDVELTTEFLGHFTCQGGKHICQFPGLLACVRMVCESSLVCGFDGKRRDG